jgi:hypothetical protein
VAGQVPGALQVGGADARRAALHAHTHPPLGLMVSLHVPFLVGALAAGMGQMVPPNLSAKLSLQSEPSLRNES